MTFLVGRTLPAPSKDSTENEDKDTCNGAMTQLGQIWDQLKNVSCQQIDIHDDPMPYTEKEDIFSFLLRTVSILF